MISNRSLINPRGNKKWGPKSAKASLAFSWEQRETPPNPDRAKPGPGRDAVKKKKRQAQAGGSKQGFFCRTARTASKRETFQARGEEHSSNKLNGTATGVDFVPELARGKVRPEVDSQIGSISR